MAIKKFHKARSQEYELMDRSAWFDKYIVLSARYYFGAHTIISGLNHYLLFFPDPIPMKPDITGQFMRVLINSHMYDVSRVIEIISGALLIIGLFVPIALIIEMPVTMIIFYSNVIMTGAPRTIFTGFREVFLNLFLLTAYWGYFRPIFMKPILPLRPLWREAFGHEGAD